MDQMTKKTKKHDISTENNTAKSIVGIIFGVIGVILGLRLIFKLLGANPDNGFIKVIYGVTQFIVGIFEGIFSEVSVGSSGDAVFEPATLIAIVLVALIALLVMKLMKPSTSSSIESSEHTGTINNK